MSIKACRHAKRRRILYFAVLFGVIGLAMCTAQAYAQTTTPPAATWCSGLDNFTSFLSGSIVKYISLGAIFIGGAALIFGEDIGSFSKRLLSVAVAASVLVCASSFFTTFFVNPNQCS